MRELRKIQTADELEFGKLTDPKSGEGIVPVVCMDEQQLAMRGLGGYLMQGFANFEAVVKTFQTGKATFWSRDKQRLWTKGEKSGNFLLVREAYTDCDNDSLLLDVEALGAACHTGAASCFEVPSGNLTPSVEVHLVGVFDWPGFLGSITTLDGRGDGLRKGKAPETYSEKLIADDNELVKKLSSEQGELIREICRPDFDQSRFVGESADVVYSVMLACAQKGIPISEVFNELARRNQKQ